MHISKYLDYSLGSFILGIGAFFAFKSLVILILFSFVLALFLRRYLAIAILIFIFSILGGFLFKINYVTDSSFSGDVPSQVSLVGRFSELNKKDDYFYGEFRPAGGYSDTGCFIFTQPVLVFTNFTVSHGLYDVYSVSGDIKYIKERRSPLPPFLTLSVKSQSFIRESTDLIFSIKEAANGVRGYIRESLFKAMSRTGASLASGYIVGGSFGLTQDIVSDFRVLSLSHILAVSGYNVTIISVIAASIFSLFMARKRAIFFSCLVVIFFCFVAGLSASVVRAGIMGCFALAASMFGRSITPFRAVLISAGLMSIYNPLILIFDIGFQLSFLAVIGLLYLSPYIQKKFESFNYWGLGESLAVTLSAQIMVLPLIAYYFGSLSVLGVVANLVITPFIPYVMGIASLSTISFILSDILAYVIAIPADWIAVSQVKAAAIFSSIPFASAPIKMSLWFMLGLYVFLIFLLIRLSNEEY